MAIELARICGACDRECPGWAARCPACGSLSLLHRLTVIPASVVAPSASLATRAANDYTSLAKPARKSVARSRGIAGRESKPRKTPLAGEPETRAV
jgi:predicted ATP-dependent serine protease